MPERITYAVAKEFFAALEDNEECMGEGAALAVTLNEFGYDDTDYDVLGEMAEAMERGEAQRKARNASRRNPK